MKLVFVVLFFILSSGLGAQQKAPEPNQGLSVFTRYSGAYKLTVSEGSVNLDPQPLIIKNQQEFEAFVGHLPPLMITKTVPAPASRDPLVKLPRFDWDHLMMLVVFDSHSLSFPPNVARVEVRDNQLIAVVEYPDLVPMIEAKPLEIGSYGAALVQKSDLSIHWQLPEKRTLLKKPESPMMLLPSNSNGGD